MITFEDIRKANEQIKSTPISGKEYAEVNQRIKAFRMVYPTGTIKTEVVSVKDGICIIRAVVEAPVELREGCFETFVLGTGTAYEKEGSSFINKTSYIENCETSAVGRALGMAGFGIDVSIASAEEVSNAILNQEPAQAPAQEPTPPSVSMATAFQISQLRKLASPEQFEAMQTKYGNNLEQMSFPVAQKALAKLNPMRKDA